jgi:tryptophan-rich sensory protein
MSNDSTTGKNLVVRIIKLAVCVVVCQLAGVIGSLFTAPAVPGWYASLVKPSFTPPSWVFSPVWITLFLLMGIAAFLVWDKGLRTRGVLAGLVAFDVQLVLNVTWSAAFFGLRSPGAGLAVIAVLWIAILTTIVLFYRVSRPAAVLMLPYILWVSFAAILNVSLFSLNA